MATPRDKFMELRKSGVDAQTARKQAYGDITPVAPVAGQVNNMPKSQQQADIENNIAAGKVVNAIGGDTEQRQTTRDWASKGMSQEEIQAIYNRPNWGKPQNTTPMKQSYNAANYIMPDGSKNPSMLGPNEVNPGQETGTNPVAPPITPPAPITPPEVKTETPVKTEVKAETKPTEVAPPPITIGDMYNNLVNRIDVTPEMKTMPTFKIAQNRFNKANMLASMTPAELSSEMQQSRIVEGSPAWEDLKTMNPTLVNNVKALNTVNGVKPEIFTYVNNPDGSKVVKNNLQDAFVSDYEDNYSDIVQTLRDIYNPDSAQQARDAIYTPEVRQAEEKATAIELQMNALSDTIANIDSDVEKEYEGTGASGSRIALEKEFRNEKLSNRYNSLLKNYTTYANKANNLITQNSDIYKSAQAQKTALQGALAGVAVNKYEASLAPATFQTIGGKVYKVQNGELTDTGLSAATNEWQSANITRYNPSTGANESTPIFYRKKDNGAGFEAVDLSGNPVDANLIGGISGGTGYTGGATTGIGAGTGGSLDLPRTGNNVGQDANNPGNITVIPGVQAPAGSIGTYKSPNGRSYYVFPDMQTGLSAQANDIKAKQSGNTSTGITGNSTLQEYLKVHVNGPSGGPIGKEYLDRVIKATGLTANTKIGSVDPTLLAKGVAAGEGVDINKNATIPQQSQTPASTAQFNPLQVREFEAYDGKTIPAQYKTPMEQDQFVRDYNKWIANKPGIKIETGDDVLKIKLDKPTGEQSAALAYGARMVNASKAVTKFEDEFLKLPIEQQYYQSKVPDILASQNQKSLEREKQDFITAVLRKESGAAISPSEFAAQDRIFFPQPGDGPDVVIAKRNARNFRVKAMLGTAGYDAQGNTPATYFTPEVIVASEPPTSTAPTGETPEQRIARLRNQNK